MTGCPVCGHAVPAGAKYCNECGTNLTREIRSDPSSRRDKPGPPAERKPVTIFFADIVGSTSKAEALDPEEWREVVAGAHQRVGEAVGRYGGTVAQLLGDGVLAFFGAPVTHEDDPERAVRAALDLQEAIRSYAADLAGYVEDFAMRVGIHAGTVVVGEIGSEEKSEYLAVGDAVNVAARLEGAAEPGQIVISEAIARRVRPSFALADMGPIDLKGKSEPLQVYAVTGKKSVPDRPRGLEAAERVFVGRRRELEELQGALLDLCRGHGQIRFILGEAGIGKSRLVEELREHPPQPPAGEQLLAQPQDVHWLEGRALSYGGSLSYWLVSQLLLADLGLSDGAPAPQLRAALRKRTAEILADRAAEFCPFLSRLLGLKLDPKEEERISQYDSETLGRELRRAILAYFEALADQTPTALLLEDLHWADASSLEVFGQLLTLTNRAPLMIVGLMRVERDHGSWDLKVRAERDYGHRYGEISLKPLAGGEAEQILASVLGSDSEQGAVAELVLGKAEGNPFYLEELLRHLLERQLIVQVNGSWKLTAELKRVGVPETLQGVLLARIDRLEEDVQHTLQLASVIGRSFLYRILAAISEAEEELDRHLDQLQRVDLIRERARLPELEYIFKHALTQEATYSSLLLERRQQFHRRVAEAVEGLFPDRLEEFAGLLAHHYESAGEREKAIDYLMKAADRARVEDSLSEARELLKRLLLLAQELRDDDLAAKTWMKLGTLFQAEFQFKQSKDAFAEFFSIRRSLSGTDSQSRNITLPDQTLRVPITTNALSNLNLHQGYVLSGDIARGLLAGLAYLDVEMNIIPHMAKWWDVVDGGCRYMFQLREDARWSDGSPLTAEDFVRSWLWGLRTGTAGNFLDDIQGAVEYRQGNVEDPRSVGLRAAAADLLEVSLKQPSANFLYIVTRSVSFPVPPLAESEGVEWWRSPDATFNGPMKLLELGDSGFVNARNEFYAGPRAGNIGRIECHAYQTLEEIRNAYLSDELDLVFGPSLGSIVSGVPERDIYSTRRGLWMQYFMLNPSNPPTDNLHFRKALAYATDRSLSMHRADHLDGYRTMAHGGIVPPGMAGHSPEIGIRYNPNKALGHLQEFLDATGSASGELRLGELGRPPTAWIQEHIDNWTDVLGFGVRREMFDYGDVRSLYRSQPHVYFQGWIADYPDPHNFISNFAVHTLEDLAGTVDDHLAGLVKEAEQSHDRKKRLELFRAADRYMVSDQALIIPIYYGGGGTDFVKPWVKNFRRSALGEYRLPDVIIEPH